MATWADVSRLALALPETEEGTTVLIRLLDIDLDLLEETVTEAWLARAPKRLVRAYLA